MKNFLHASVLALALLSSPALFAQDATVPASPSGPPSGAGETPAGGGQGGKWREAFEKLNLTDAKKSQIKQIRASTTPGKERRQQIMAVLTPAQKEQLLAMFKVNQGAQ